MRIENLALSLGFGLTLAACGPDDRVSYMDEIKGGTPANEFPASCLIDIYDSENTLMALCSGALIAPGVVLTAGHCVSGFASFQVLCPYLDSTQYPGQGEAHPNYHAGKNRGVVGDSDDIGLVYLQTSIPMTRYPTVRATPLPDGSPVVNVGRVKDGVPSRSDLYRSTPVKIQRADSIGFTHDYMTADKIQPGDSGGPDYRSHPTEREVVAVNSGAGNGFEVLGRVDLVYKWIDSRVRSHGGWQLPPGYRGLTPPPPALRGRPGK